MESQATAAPIPASHRDLLEDKVYAILTTVMPDGQPQSTVVWVDYDGAYVRVNTAAGRQKDKNMRRNPKVTLSLVDPDDPFRWLEIRGTVDEIDETSGLDHINRLAKKYMGASAYYGHVAPVERQHKEKRIMFKIRPTRVVPFPPTRRG